MTHGRAAIVVYIGPRRQTTVAQHAERRRLADVVGGFRLLRHADAERARDAEERRLAGLWPRIKAVPGADSGIATRRKYERYCRAAARRRIRELVMGAFWVLFPNQPAFFAGLRRIVTTVLAVSQASSEDGDDEKPAATVPRHRRPAEPEDATEGKIIAEPANDGEN